LGHLPPNALKAARPRYSAAQGKTDLGDAYLLADLLRTDGHRFRTMQPLSDETKALRGLVRTRDDLVERRVALANQLRSLLGDFWPGAEHAVDAHVAHIVTPLFRSTARICAGQRLAELGDDRARFVSADHLAAEAGVAPVTREHCAARVFALRAVDQEAA
jgi:transposase